MSHVEQVREVAKSLMLVDEKEGLMVLDSITLVEFLTALEEKTNLTIPTALVNDTTFKSLESVAAMLDQLASKTK